MWRRKWQSTPVFLPEKSHGGGSLVGYSPKDHNELDTTEQQQTENKTFLNFTSTVILISIWVFKFLRNCVKYTKSAISLGHFKVYSGIQQINNVNHLVPEFFHHHQIC